MNRRPLIIEIHACFNPKDFRSCILENCYIHPKLTDVPEYYALAKGHIWPKFILEYEEKYRSFYLEMQGWER